MQSTRPARSAHPLTVAPLLTASLPRDPRPRRVPQPMWPSISFGKRIIDPEQGAHVLLSARDLGSGVVSGAYPAPISRPTARRCRSICAA